MPASKENITRVTRDELRHLKGETDYARLDAMTDDDIARAVAARSQPSRRSTSTGTRPASSLPPGKDGIITPTFLDRDILDYLRAQGKSCYQTLINKVLRTWYDATLHQGSCESRRGGEARGEKSRPLNDQRRRPPPSPRRQRKSALEEDPRPAHDGSPTCAKTASARSRRRAEACGSQADVNVDALPEAVTVPKVGQRLRCSRCGGKGVSTRPAWHTARRSGVPDFRPPAT